MMKRLTLFFGLCLLAFNLPGQSVTIWPGDANNNGVANHVDLLYVGLNYGSTGPARIPPSGVWAAQAGFLWGSPVFPLPDASYADCNGDGTINFADRQTITANFGLTHGSLVADSSSISNQFFVPDLNLVVPFDTLVAGRTYVLDLQFGSPAGLIDSLYGLAFTLSYDTSLVDTLYADFSSSWLAGGGTTLLDLQVPEDSLLHVGVTRINRVNAVAGSGSIGGVVIVMVDNLKTSATTASLNIQFQQVLALTASGGVVKAYPRTEEATVISGQTEPTWAAQVALVPSPARDWVQLQGPPQLFRAGTLQVFDAQGRQVGQWQLSQLAGQRLSTAHWQAGLYFLRMQGPGFSMTRTLPVVHE